jgi:hypothetical protein
MESDATEVTGQSQRSHLRRVNIDPYRVGMKRPLNLVWPRQTLEAILEGYDGIEGEPA